MTKPSWLHRLFATQSLPQSTRPLGTALRLRLATPDDAKTLRRLAALDSNRPPRGLVLLAEVDGQPWAAVSVDDQHLVADPFRPTGELEWTLIERARELRRKERGRMHALPRVWPAMT